LLRADAVATMWCNGSLPQTALFNISTPTTIGGQLCRRLAGFCWRCPPTPQSGHAQLLPDLGFGNLPLQTKDYRAELCERCGDRPVDERDPTQANPNGLPALTARGGAPAQGCGSAADTTTLRNGGWGAPLDHAALAAAMVKPQLFFLERLGHGGVWDTIAAGLVTVWMSMRRRRQRTHSHRSRQPS